MLILIHIFCLDMKINLLRGAQVTVNDNPLENYDNIPQSYYPDIKISKAGLYTIVNATNFMVRWDGGINKKCFKII